jgi:uncharacterized protein YjeT (DUF2065 family)
MFETIFKEKRIGNMTIVYPKKKLSLDFLREAGIVFLMFGVFIIYMIVI